MSESNSPYGSNAGDQRAGAAAGAGAGNPNQAYTGTPTGGNPGTNILGAAPTPAAGTKALVSYQTLTQILSALGVTNFPLNPTLTDISEAAGVIQALHQQITDILSAGGDLTPDQQATLQQLQDQVATAGQQFTDYTTAYVNNLDAKTAATYVPAVQDIFQQFQQVVKPATPQVARLPTAAEFLSDFNNAWDTATNEMNLDQAGLDPEMKAWMHTEFKTQMLSKYQTALGQIAQTGQSPFNLSEVPFDQRYPGAAGQAMVASEGNGPAGGVPQLVTGGGPTRIVTINGQQVTVDANGSVIPGGAPPPVDIEHLQNADGTPATPTGSLLTSGVGSRVNPTDRASILAAQTREEQTSQSNAQKLTQDQSIEAAQVQADTIGHGTPRDFIALPKIMPLDFINANMTPGMVKLEYEGSRTGAGRRYLMGGQVTPKVAGGQL